MHGHQPILETGFEQLPTSQPLVEHPNTLEPVGLLADAFRQDGFRIIAVEHLCCQLSLLGKQSLEGINHALHEQGAKLIGGHTMEGRQHSTGPAELDLQISLSVFGSTPQGLQPWSKGPVQHGDLILMSRAIGSGILFAAAMQGIADPIHVDQALDTMAISQHRVLEALLDISQLDPQAIHACTDVKGFGLLGHLNEMLAQATYRALSSGLIAFPPFTAFVHCSNKASSTLAPANRRALSTIGKSIHLPSPTSEENLLIDPQTCGPLLLACSQKSAEQLIHQGWHHIGQVL